MPNIAPEHQNGAAYEIPRLSQQDDRSVPRESGATAPTPPEQVPADPLRTDSSSGVASSSGASSDVASSPEPSIADFSHLDAPRPDLPSAEASNPDTLQADTPVQPEARSLPPVPQAPPATQPYPEAAEPYQQTPESYTQQRWQGHGQSDSVGPDRPQPYQPHAFGAPQSQPTAGFGAPQQTGAFAAPPAPQTGVFAVPQHTSGAPMPTHVEGRTAPQSIMPLDLSQAALVRTRKEEPTRGWRRALYKASFGGINPGISKEQVERNALLDRVRTPIPGCHKIAVVSLKGGIGKTTTTSCLGLTLAHYRGDRVVALDANPDAGTLAERLTGTTDVSVRTMLDNLTEINSFTDISRYMSLAGRLQVLASDQDAEISEAFDADQYTQVTDLLARYYNVILTDSGTGMLHSAMKGTLEEANSLVVVGAPSVDGSSRASKTLDWLVAHGYGDLVSRSVAVISSVREKSDSVDMNVLRSHFGARCRAVVEIPYDPHLVIGGRIDMTQLRSETELAYVELAAAVADGFHPVDGSGRR